MNLVVLRPLLVGCVIMASVGGCSRSPDDAFDADSATFAQYRDEEPGVGDSALLEGTVSKRDECQSVTDSTSSVAYVPIFPTSSLSQAKSLKTSDKVSLRGGSVEAAAPEGAQLPTRCPTSGPFWVVAS
ncbi:hypothetical protein [Micromonospora tulbaghiae]|uniref:hypothetical protein n=1 Tax=Micromonospora tulbaghiae TaxID=479978 RepID=UPI0013C40CF1|nr:hypothetical protein [Micromonospora tulbaghiae]